MIKAHLKEEGEGIVENAHEQKVITTIKYQIINDKILVEVAWDKYCLM